MNQAVDAVILLVDDDAQHLERAAAFLRERGLEVITSSSALGVSRMIYEHAPRVVVLDVMMPAIDGDELVRILDRQPHIKRQQVIYHSALEEDQLAHMASRRPGTGYVAKSAGFDALYQAILRMTSAPAPAAEPRSGSST
jgi:CheY-like chemotaxis protein